jgi:hypothetical protein
MLLFNGGYDDHHKGIFLSLEFLDLLTRLGKIISLKRPLLQRVKFTEIL